MFFFECPSLFSMTSVPPHLWNAFEHVQRCSEGALFAFVDIHRFVDGNAQIGLIAPSISRTCTSCWRKMAVISVFCPHTKNGEQLPNPIIFQNKKTDRKNRMGVARSPNLRYRPGGNVGGHHSHIHTALHAISHGALANQQPSVGGFRLISKDTDLASAQGWRSWSASAKTRFK